MSSPDLAARLARLSPEQRAQLLERLRQVPAVGTPPMPPLTPRPADAGALPLSFAQQRLWFLAQLDPEDTSYNICRTLELRGPLQVAALEAALEALVHRHEALRTTFPSVEGQPTQHIAAPAPLAQPVTDLSGHPAAAREALQRQLIDQLGRRPFDLARGPLLRTHLLRLEAEVHVLVLGVHHIAMDGWSLGVLLDELAAIYGAQLRGEPPALPAMPVQYADHALWERGWLRGAVLDEQLTYWRQQLAGAPAPIELSVRPRPGRPSLRGAHRVVTLPLQPARAVTALAQEEGASAFMALLGAFLVLLHVTTGEEDLVVGTPIAHRTRSEIERLIGYFANTLALRVRLSPRDSFRALLRNVRAVCLDAYSHQDVPFEKLVEELKPPRSLGRAPFFQLMFQLEDNRFAPRPLPGLDVRLMAEDNGASAYDLALGLAWRPEGLVADAQYSTDLFDGDEVGRLLEQLGRIVELVAAAPDCPVQDLRIPSAAQRRLPAASSDAARPPSPDRDPGVPRSQLELLRPAERAALFEEPARCVAWEPRGPGVMAQIERRMAMTPDAPAILSEAGCVDYRELDARSAALAARLRRRGVGPDRTVAVVAERGAPQILAIVAVLRAGGAYVPIKPDLPGERIGWMLDEAAPVVILCDGPPPSALALATRHADRIVRLDEPWPEAPEVSAARDPQDGSAVPADALAYIIYTSGSTGRPKGVLVTRRGFDAQLRWMQDEYPLAARDRVLQLASAMFDFSVIEMFWPLLVGGALVLPRPGGEMDPAYLARIAGEHAATVVHFVPSLLRVVIDACRGTPWTTIEQVFCGGEALARDLVRDCSSVFPRAAVHNQYGPTETTINATYWRCQPDDTSVPIGRPVADTTVYVLDDELAPVPPGGVGQLWIGGVQLARGYLQRPALTAERFRPNPFAARPGERIYQTGDLVRQRGDGVLDYLGRTDFQVKLRGFRIELGEIEAALLDHPRVRAALVVVRDERPGDASAGAVLVAYVCLVDPAASSHGVSGELQGFLAARLPGYMIPSAFVVLDELPRTASGKLDRTALPAPADDAHQRTAYVAPATPTQTLLAEIWREMLGVDQVGVHDSFFALGGHSLLVVRLVARIHRRLGVELTIRSVFESPTIAGQAERILARAGSPEASAGDPAERELVAHAAELPEAEVSAQLAEWSSVLLDIPPASAASELTGARRELAERLIAQHRIDVRPSQPLARGTSPTAPATFAQQLQWDYHQRGNFPTLGIQATAFAVRGRLEVQAMQQAIGDLVERQAALRTVFTLERGRLTQAVQDVGPGLDVVDLSGVPAAERTRQARRLFAAINRPHDLGREVFRAQLVRRGPDDHLLFLAPHHIANDGFSWSVLEAELAALYGARSAAADAGAGLAPLALSCRDFSFWQRSLEDRPAGRAQLAFWERAVAGYPGVELPGDRRAAPRGSIGMATDTYEAGSLPFGVDGSRWSAVERACARLGTTPYVAITSGFLLLVSRWSGRDDVCALSGHLHRNRPGSEAVIGNFVTPYPLRVAFDEGASLDAPSSARGAWVEWSRYNVNYQIGAPGAGALDYGAAKVERLDWSAPAQRTPHDLALFVRQDARGVGGDLVYNAERFSPELAARAGARLGQLIDLIANEPSRRVGALPRAP
ncbi:MAG: amino acid adenylation domain-containing protein [Deltaproteobacteria bacterium]|nr:MAG: amino acid adenylation domain-containing protein [Deltaproteobacteria bacterium]